MTKEPGALPGWADVRALSPDEIAPLDNFVQYFAYGPAIDLSVQLEDSVDPVLPGQAFRYALTVTNHGPSAATGMEATVRLGTGTTALPSIVSFTSRLATSPLACPPMPSATKYSPLASSQPIESSFCPPRRPGCVRAAKRMVVGGQNERCALAAALANC